MKYFELEKEEQKILDAIASDTLKSIRSVRREADRYRGYARRTLGKPRNINIRLSERDLQKMKALAAEKGLPYQTFVSSLLHQYSTRQ